MTQTRDYTPEDLPRIATSLGSWVLHSAVMMPVFDTTELRDRKLAADLMAQLLNARTVGWTEESIDFWTNLKDHYMTHEWDRPVTEELAKLTITWLQGVVAQPEIEDPFEV